MSNDPTDTMTVPLSAELLRQFGNVALFASKDKARPILTCLNVEQIEQGGRRGVAIVATDSYALAWAEVFPTEPADAPSGMSEVKLSVEAIKPIVATLKAAGAAKHPNGYTLEMGENRWQLVDRTTGNAAASGETYSGTFPNWRQLIPNVADLARSDVSRFTIDAAYFAKFAKMKGVEGSTVGTGCARVWNNVDEQLKPLAWHQADAAVRGLLMPVRVADGGADTFTDTFTGPANQR